jgi:hypothetical protein
MDAIGHEEIGLEPALRLIRGHFREREPEHAFRQFNHPAERFQVLWYVFISIISHFMFVIFDFMLLAHDSLFIRVLMLRLGFALLSLPVLLLMRRQKPISRSDGLLLAWAIAFVLTAWIISLTRPPGFIPVVAWEVILILTIFAILPIRIEFQLIATLILSLLSMLRVLYFTVSVLRDPAALSAALVFPVTVLIGFLISWHLNRIRREQYLTLVEEQRTKAELEKALLEVRELQGLIPICANCKSIRDDQGYWKSVEAYISDHSKAIFSHGICPTCATKLYPGIKI